MGIFSRFFGKGEPEDESGELVAEPTTDDSPAFQLLFAGSLQLKPPAVTAALRAYHPTMARARFESADALDQEGKVFGLAGWGEHVIKVVGFNLPMPKEVVELCVAPSHYGQPLKERARGHKSHALLWYAGRANSVVERFVALAAFAGALEPFGVVAVLNESARTSFPAAALAGKGVQGDTLELIRTMPLPALFCGFVKYDVPEGREVWMRTYGAYVLGLPDFAVYTSGHHEGERYFQMIDSIMRYMLNTGSRLGPGHTMQLGDDDFLRCRAPADDESWLESPGEVLVVEIIKANQINR